MQHVMGVFACIDTRPFHLSCCPLAIWEAQWERGIVEGSTVPFSKGVLNMLCCAVVGRSHSQSGEQTQVMPFEYDAEHAVLCCAVLCCAVLCRSHSQPILKVMMSMLCCAVVCRSYSQPGEQVQAGHANSDAGHSSAEDGVHEVEAGGACCGSPVPNQQIALPCLGCSLP